MKVHKRIGAGVCYFISIAAFVLWALCSFGGLLEGSPLARLLMIMLSCVMCVIGSRLLVGAAFKDDYEKSMALMKLSFGVFFLVYVVFLLHMVLFDGYFDRVGTIHIGDKDYLGAVAEYARSTANLIPFKSILCFVTGLADGTVSFGMAARNIVGNIAAFAPFAFFLPLFFRKQRKVWIFAITVSAIIIAVEISQLVLMTGFADIDDLILNLLGALIFYGVLRLHPCAQLLHRLTFTDIRK